MAVISLLDPTLVNRQTWGQKRFDLRFQSGDSGAGQSRILAPSRWTTSIASYSDLQAADSAAWRTMILALNGQINQLAVYNISNPAPRGTMRGTLALNASVVAGATTLAITGGAGQASTTLLAGDFIGVGSGSTRQLVTIAADATANGAGLISVTIQQPMRYAQSGGSGVTWDKPTALFRVTGDASSWDAGVFEGGYSLDLMESWE